MAPSEAGAGEEPSPGAGAPDASATAAASGPEPGFSVRLDEFEGPFDLLLSLIAKHKLDVTVLALHTVIDDFLAHIRAAGPDWDLDEATEFLVVAATLLDLKAARLLPSGEVEDEEDLALLEARDLLFARLLQYRAYKDVSAVFAEMMLTGGRRHPREVGLDPEFAGLLPEVLIGLGPLEFAALAAKALQPKVVPTVSVSHIHARAGERAASRPRSSSTGSSGTRRRPSAASPPTATRPSSSWPGSWRCSSSTATARSAFDQVTPLGELHIRWTGSSDGVVEVEEYDGAPPPAVAAVDPVIAEATEDAVEVTDADISDYFRHPAAPDTDQDDRPDDRPEHEEQA